MAGGCDQAAAGNGEQGLLDDLESGNSVARFVETVENGVAEKRQPCRGSQPSVIEGHASMHRQRQQTAEAEVVAGEGRQQIRHHEPGFQQRGKGS